MIFDKDGIVRNKFEKKRERDSMEKERKGLFRDNIGKKGEGRMNQRHDGKVGRK